MEQVTEKWGLVTHRGLLALAFGLLTLFGPGASFAWFAPLMLLYAMSDGVLAIAAAARAAYVFDSWLWLLVEGLAGLNGIFVIAAWPEVNLRQLTWSVSGWAAVTAIGAVATAAKLGERLTCDWLLAAAVVLARFAVLAIGAIRAGESGIAFWSGAGALVLASLFLARILCLRLTAKGRRPQRLAL